MTRHILSIYGLQSPKEPYPNPVVRSTTNYKQMVKIKVQKALGQAEKQLFMLAIVGGSSAPLDYQSLVQNLTFECRKTQGHLMGTIKV